VDLIFKSPLDLVSGLDHFLARADIRDGVVAAALRLMVFRFAAQCPYGVSMLAGRQLCMDRCESCALEASSQLACCLPAILALLTSSSRFLLPTVSRYRATTDPASLVLGSKDKAAIVRCEPCNLWFLLIAGATLIGDGRAALRIASEVM
jgi:hypothetical protein